ncbi:MAG: HAMP domain-containing histidine kinase, partial [Elusimicrobia bacterium]|nr:HAMP domain-containing histidine kinase [Elusimicrobiota bacterium]
MRFANKVFLLTFLVAGLLGFGVTWASRSYVKRQARDTYVSKYSLLSESLGHALHQLEGNAEKLMYSAGKVVVMEDDRAGLLPTERLKQFRDELSVTHIFVIDAKGRFVRSTNEDPKLIPNLYSFCSEYSNLIAGGVRSMGTPIIPPTPEPKPYKFLTLPNASRTRMVEVGLRVDFIGGTLSKALQSDPNVVNLNLYAPDGTSLGNFSKNDFNMVPGKAALPEQVPSVVETKDAYQFFTKVPSTQPRCCQCEVSGISKDSEYYYVLESRISKAELGAALASIERFFLLVAVFSLIVALVTAKIVSRTLVQRLERVISGIREAKHSKSLGTQLEVGGKDEIAQLASEFNGLLGALSEAQTEIVNSKREAARGELAQQVSHDIRSPLAALDSVSTNVSQLPEEQRLIIRSAVGRIGDIANQLLGSYRREAPAAAIPTDGYLLSSLIAPIITEKRLQFRSHLGIEIGARLDSAAYGHFAAVEPTEFKRVLSNLIDNGVEALPGKGAVTVSLSGQGGSVQLKVDDNGKGIPPDVRERLGQRGETHGKPGGSGLGLYHAKTCVEAWGGSLEIASEVGKGTSLLVTLPAAPPPAWFVSRLELVPNSPVIVLDDDTTVHQIWQGRFDALAVRETGVEALHFSRADELRVWVRSNPDKAASALYLLDYELRGHTETGLTLVEELGLGHQAILVTSRFEEKAILDECLRLNVRMIPKGLAGFVSIRCLPSMRPDAVLIDDDHLV